MSAQRRRITRQRFFYRERHMTSLGLQAIGTGRCQKRFREEQPIRHRRVPWYVLILITRGRGWFWSEQSGSFDCKTGDGFLLFPGERHGYGVVDGHDFEETWVAFAGQGAVLAEEEGLYSRRCAFYPELSKTAGDWVERIYQAGYANDVQEQGRMPGWIHQMLIEIDRRQERAGELGDPQLERIRERLCEEATGTVDLEALARECGLGYSSMRVRFREAYGMPPGRYHLVQKMNVACSLLSSGLRVTEVANAVGIEDSFYFSRLFKRYIGQSPQVFLKTQTAS